MFSGSTLMVRLGCNTFVSLLISPFNHFHIKHIESKTNFDYKVSSSTNDNMVKIFPTLSHPIPGKSKQCVKRAQMSKVFPEKKKLSFHDDDFSPTKTSSVFYP